jgi:glycosyltransferase involved in cell wall biosynthesis
VKFLGFRNQTELPRFYDLADLFVLPSAREPWGLVVNEAMNAAKPVIVSDRVGAGPDLVRDGSNGFVVPVGEVGALTDRLRALTSDPGLCRAMGHESAKRIRNWDFQSDLEGLRAALDVVVGPRR